jgi:hypothetical protein
MNTSNYRVVKYYVTQKNIVFLTLAPVNKPVKFELKAKRIFFCIKKIGMYRIPDSHFTVKIHKSNIQ